MKDWPEKPYLEPKTAGQTYLEWLYGSVSKVEMAMFTPPVQRHSD